MNPLKNVVQQCFKKKTRRKKTQNVDVLNTSFFEQVLSLSDSQHQTPATTGSLAIDVSSPTRNSHLAASLAYTHCDNKNFSTSQQSIAGTSGNNSSFGTYRTSVGPQTLGDASQHRASICGNNNSSQGSRAAEPHQNASSVVSLTFVSRAAVQQHISSSGVCMTGTVCGKRKSPFPNPGQTGPFGSCHVHTFAALKRPRKEMMVRLLDLSEDILVSIMTHVMTPAKEGSRRIVTEENLRASLPLAKTCHALYGVWRQSMNDVELWVSGRLNDRGLKAICKGNGSGIHRLGLRRCKEVSQKAFAHIPRQCNRLRSLDMSHTDITDEFVDELTNNTGRTLQFLAFHGCTQLTARSIHAIADRCPHLRFLDIGSVPSVDDAAIGYLVRRLGGSIRTMILSNCEALSDTAMATIGAGCKSLMSLTIRGLPSITDYGLQKLCSGIGERVQILDVLDCSGLTMGGYFAAMEAFCPHVFRYLEESNYVDHLGERCLRDNIIATMPGLIYRISATDAIRRLPALYFLLLDESTLRPFRVSVQSKSLNLSDFGTVLISNFGKKPTPKTKNVLLNRFGYDSPFDSEKDNESCDRV